MKVVLAFAPCASPTYVPLGIASLSAFINANNPDCHANAVDLNIATWNWIIDQKKEYQSFRDFIQGKENGFFDETLYEMHQSAWKQLKEIQDTYIQMALCYLEKNNSSTKKSSSHIFMAPPIPLN